MRYVASTERRVKGPLHFAEKLPPPREPFQDIAVLAFPAPQNDADTIAAHSPRVTCTPPADGAERMVDGDRKTTCLFPKGAGQGKTPFTVDMEVAEPFTARSLVLYPAEMQFAAQCELQAAGEDGVFHTIRDFPLDRSNTNVQRGADPVRAGGRVLSRPDGQALSPGHHRACASQGGLAEIELSGAARLERFVEKQLGKMHPTPLPMWDTYLWPKTAEPESPGFAVPPGAVLNLSDKLAPDGTLRWDVPGRGMDHPPHRHDADGHPQRARLARRPGAGSGQDEPRRRPGALRCLYRQAPGSGCRRPTAKPSSTSSPTATRWARRIGRTASTTCSASATATTRVPGCRC